MANPHRGQVPLVAGGVTYTLSMSINAMCALEAHIDRPIGRIVMDIDEAGRSLATLRMTLVRSLLWGALQDHHPDIGIAGAGEILTLSGIPAAMQAVTEAVRLSLPLLTAKEEGAPSRPPEKATG